eukprot:m.1116714 g.1116714  ORF g.1116714 m.1116714 type:complete len:575 (+) comp24379_c0_seq7:306-2030(+)
MTSLSSDPIFRAFSIPSFYCDLDTRFPAEFFFHKSMDAYFNTETCTTTQRQRKPGSPMGSARAMQLLDRYKNSSKCGTRSFGFRNWTAAGTNPLTPPRRKEQSWNVSTQAHSEQPKSLSKVVQETLAAQELEKSNNTSTDPVCLKIPTKKCEHVLGVQRCTVPGMEDLNFSDSDEDVFFDQQPRRGTFQLTPPLMRKNKNPVRTTAKERQARFKRAAQTITVEKHRPTTFVISNKGLQERLALRRRIEGYVAVALDTLECEDAFKEHCTPCGVSGVTDDSSTFEDWDYISIEHRASDVADSTTANGDDGHAYLSTEHSDSSGTKPNAKTCEPNDNRVLHKEARLKRRSRSGCLDEVTRYHSTQKGFSASEISKLGLSSDFLPASVCSESAFGQKDSVYSSSCPNAAQEHSVGSSPESFGNDPVSARTHSKRSIQRVESTSSSSDDDACILPGRAPIRNVCKSEFPEVTKGSSFRSRLCSQIHPAEFTDKQECRSGVVPTEELSNYHSFSPPSSPCSVKCSEEDSRGNLIEQQFLMQYESLRSLESPTDCHGGAKKINHFVFSHPSQESTEQFFT